MPKEKKMYRDMLGGEIPQYFNEETDSFVVLANGDVSNVDFGKTKLLRDKLGGVIPNQIYDVATSKWIIGEGGSGGGSKLEQVGIRHFYTTVGEDPENALNKVFFIDFVREPGDFLEVFFNGEILGITDFMIVDDAVRGDYIRINTTRPIDFDYAELQGYLFRGFKAI